MSDHPDTPREDLSEIRRRLDEADQAILKALRSRIDAARLIGDIKRRHGAGIRDSSRELEVHARWASRAESLSLNAHAAGRVLREILEWSRREQEALWRDSGGREAVVAYQGAPGAHCDREQALDEAELQRLAAGITPLLAAQGRSIS